MDETRRRTTHSLSRSLTHSLPATFFLLSFALSSVFSSHVKSRQERQRTTPTSGGRVSPAIIGLRDALRVMMSCEPDLDCSLQERAAFLVLSYNSPQFAFITRGPAGKRCRPLTLHPRGISLSNTTTPTRCSAAVLLHNHHGCRINAARG